MLECIEYPSQGHTASKEPIWNLIPHLTDLKAIHFGTLLNCLIISYFDHCITLFYLSLYL